MNSASLLQVIKKRRSVRVYKAGKISDKQLEAILEAARWAPSGANTQPWEFVVTRDREKMKRCREIFYNEWQERKREDPINYKGLSKYYVGDASVLVLVCADPRTMMVYLTTRRPGDREKLFQASVASAVEADDARGGEYRDSEPSGFRSARRSKPNLREVSLECSAADTTALGRAHRPRSASGRAAKPREKNLRLHALRIP